MTKEEMPSRQIISMPFASGDGAALADIKLSEDLNDINFATGFPSAYSSPSENGGKFVTRGQINAIGNLASRNEFIRMLGGLNTFNKAFSDAVGGYPKGAVLDVLIGDKLFKAISLVDNNTFDVSAYGADNVTWGYLNQDNAGATEEVFFESNNVVGGSTILGTVLAKKSGGIIIKTNFSIDETDVVVSDPAADSSPSFTNYGASLVIRDLGTDISTVADIRTPSGLISNNVVTINWEEWKNIAGNYGYLRNDAGGYTWSELSLASGMFTTLIKDHYYSIAILTGAGWMAKSSYQTTRYSLCHQEISGNIKILYA